MKKIALILCLVLSLLCVTGLAESVVEEGNTGVEINSKITIWEHTMIVVDPDGNTTEIPVKVTYEPKEPVIYKVVESDSEIFLASIYKEGYAPVVVSISAANMGLHYSLNDYTDEQLQEYILSVAEENFEEGNYTSEVLKSEGGNTYVAIEDDITRSISTIYEDFVMEIYQFNIDPETYDILSLRDEDKAFALEVFQGIWTE